MKIIYTLLLLFCGMTLSAQVANDNCADAIAIGEISDQSFSNVGATTDGPLHLDSPCPGSGEPELDSLYNDIWYSYTPSFSGIAVFTTCGTANFDTKIAVYQSGATCPPSDSDLLNCNEDGANCAESTSEVLFSVTAGETYLLRLAGFGTESPGLEGEGTFSVFEFEPLVANDFCSAAIPISPGLNQEFDSFGATTDGPSHDSANPCFQFMDNSIQSDIWYLFTPDFSGPALWTTCDQIDFDSRLGVYGPNANCNDLENSLYACNDDGANCSNFTSELFFDVVEGETYLLRLGGWNGNTGTGFFDLINQAPPEAPDNDLCDNATVVPVVQMGDNSTVNGTTIAAGFDPDSFVFNPCAGQADGGEFSEVWFAFNNGGAEEITMNFFGLTQEAYFHIDIWEDCSTPTNPATFTSNCDTLNVAEDFATTTTFGPFADTPTDYIMRVYTFVTFNLPGDFEFQLVAEETSGFDTPSALIGDVVLSPNPVTNSLNLEIPLNRKSQLSYSIHDMLGKEVQSNKIGDAPSGVHQQSIDVENLNPGVYIINVSIDNQPIGIKFVKQ